MSKIYLSYRAVPELAVLPATERAAVLRASVERFGQTLQFKRVRLLQVAITLAVPVLTAIVVYLCTSSGLLALWSFVSSGLVGYTVWFHVYVTYLLPHIHGVMAGHNAPET